MENKITDDIIKEAKRVVNKEEQLNINDFFREKKIEGNLQLKKEIFIAKISKGGKYFFEIMPGSNTWYIKKRPVHWREWAILVALIITAAATAFLSLYPLLKGQ